MALKMKPLSGIKADLGIQPNGPVQLKFANLCAKKMDKYIPKDEGNLRLIKLIFPNSIVYTSPYAKYQYYGERADGSHKVRHYTTPGTGPYWDQRMWTAEGKTIISEIQKEFRI